MIILKVKNISKVYNCLFTYEASQKTKHIRLEHISILLVEVTLSCLRESYSYTYAFWSTNSVSEQHLLAHLVTLFQVVTSSVLQQKLSWPDRQSRRTDVLFATDSHKPMSGADLDAPTSCSFKQTIKKTLALRI